MTLIANLDAAIEEHYASQEDVDRELQIFGRVWRLINDLTTAQVTPLAQVQAAAEILADPTTSGSEEQKMAIQMLAGLDTILASVICEEERSDFQKVVARKGIPIAIAQAVVEAVFVAFDAAPFPTGVAATTPTPAPRHPTNTPLLVSTTDSGTSSGTVGQSSNSDSNPPQPPTQPMPVAPVAATAPQPVQPQPGLVAVPTAPEATLQPYETQIPPSVVDVQLGSSAPSHGGS